MRTMKLLIAVLLMSGATVWGADYLMEGVDPARTGWMKDEKVFTLANVKDTKLLWKVTLDSKPREMHNLFSPLIAERVTTPEGPREMALVAGVSDDLFGIDVATGKLVWTRHFDSTFTPPTGGRGGDTLCPGGQTAVPVMAQTAPGTYTVYAVSWDGRLRQVNLADGREIVPAEKFIPSNGKPYALTLVNGVIYTASAQGCGGVPNAFYSFDLASRRSSIFQPAGGGLWGRRGAAVAPEGTVYLGTGDAAFNPATRSLGNAIVGVKIDANKQLQLVSPIVVVIKQRPARANDFREKQLPCGSVDVSEVEAGFSGYVDEQGTVFDAGAASLSGCQPIAPGPRSAQHGEGQQTCDRRSRHELTSHFTLHTFHFAGSGDAPDRHRSTECGTAAGVRRAEGYRSGARRWPGVRSYERSRSRHVAI